VITLPLPLASTAAAAAPGAAPAAPGTVPAAPGTAAAAAVELIIVHLRDEKQQ